MINKSKKSLGIEILVKVSATIGLKTVEQARHIQQFGENLDLRQLQYTYRLFGHKWGLRDLQHQFVRFNINK